MGRASFNPANYVAGGLVDDADLVIQNPVFMMYDFEGKTQSGEPVCVLKVELVYDETGDEATTGYYGTGKGWVPSEDGETESESGPYLISADGRDRELIKSCGAAKFFASAIEAGCNPDVLDEAEGSCTFLDGCRAHFNQVPTGQTKTYQGREQKSTTLLPTSDWVAAGEGKKTSSKKGATKKATPAAAKKEAPSAPAGDLDETLIEILTPIIAEAGDAGLARSEITKAVRAGITDKSQMGAALARCVKGDFLKNEEAPWTFDGKVLKIE